MTDHATVHYVTQDPIQNLKIRVTLTRLSAVRSKTRVGPNDENAQPNVGVPLAPAASLEPATLTRVFAWQEKVFSPAEVVAYRAQQAAGGQPAGQPTRTSVSSTRPLVPAAGADGSKLFTYTQVCSGPGSALLPPASLVLLRRLQWWNAECYCPPKRLQHAEHALWRLVQPVLRLCKPHMAISPSCYVFQLFRHAHDPFCRT